MSVMIKKKKKTLRFWKLDRAKSFSNSQPNPSAPTTNTFAYFARSSLKSELPPIKTKILKVLTYLNKD